MNITVSTPAGDVGVGQPRYVVAYTLKQAPEQKQPDILNPDNLQSAKEVVKVKSPTATEADRLLYSSANEFNCMYPIAGNDHHQSADAIENAILESSYYMQPPHYSLLGSSSSNNVGGEKPHEYSNNYSTVIVAQTEPDNSRGGPSFAATYSSQPPLDYRLLSSVKEDDESAASSKSAGAIKPEYRYSGSDFSMSECISNSNTSTLGNNKNRNRNHIITDTLPGPESCV